MPIQANVTNNQITASVGETKVDVTVSGGVGPTGAQGPSGEASLPAGTEGYVLTYSSGSWVAAAPASGYTLPIAGASTLGGVKIGSGISIDGDGVISVSTNYAAASHTHAISDVTGLQTALDGKQVAGSYAAAVHTHGISDVTGLQTALDGKAATSHSHAISDVTGLQTALDGKQASGSYAAATHTHAISDVTNLQTTLDGKAASTHGHAISDVTGLQTALDGKQAAGSYAAATHTHAASDITSGSLDIARIPTGTSSSTVCIGNDARLSDARTPTAHNQAWSTITSTPTTRSGYGITDAQKTITSGTAAPTGGSDGDIYLQYT